MVIGAPIPKNPSDFDIVPRPHLRDHLVHIVLVQQKRKIVPVYDAPALVLRVVKDCWCGNATLEANTLEVLGEVQCVWRGAATG